jgi:hypothetical protein
VVFLLRRNRYPNLGQRGLKLGLFGHTPTPSTKLNPKPGKKINADMASAACFI